MKKLAVALLAAGLSFVAFAQAPSEGQPGAQNAQQPAFEVADKNKDGKVSREEASMVQGLDFATADVNKDSTLDRPEYVAAIAKIAKPKG